MEIGARRFVSRCDPAEKVEFGPSRQGKFATVSPGCLDRLLRVALVRPKEVLFNLAYRDARCFLEQRSFVHLPGCAVNSVHSGARAAGIHQEQCGVTLLFAPFHCSIRSDGSRTLYIGHSPNLPSLRRESLVIRERFDHIWRQATHEGHRADP